MKKTPEESKNEFIVKAKTLAATQLQFDWDNVSWGRGVTFYKYSSRNCKKEHKRNLSFEFCEFVKAYVYSFHLENSSKAQEVIKAFRLIEIALLKFSYKADITKLTHAILDEAILEAYQLFIPATVQRIYKEIKVIIGFLLDKEIISVHVKTWCFKLEKDNNSGTRPNQSAGDDKNSKLPDLRVIEFIGKVFRSVDKSPRDIFTTSIFALLLCAPSRISEVMNLNEDCLITIVDPNGAERHGLRFFAAKGFGYSIKWIPDSMVSVAQEAISRLKALGVNANTISVIISNGEVDLYKKLNKKPFDSMIITDLKKLGFDYKLINLSKECTAFINKLDKGKVSVKFFWNYINKKDVKKNFSGMTNSHYAKGKLVALNYNQLNAVKGDDIFTSIKGTKNLIKNEFLSTVKERNGYLNIFERHKTKGRSEELLTFNSHQLRHLINTLAQRTKLSEIEIAFWSGRKNINHNNNYNHITDDEMIAMSRKLLMSSENDLEVISKPLNSTIIDEEFIEMSMCALRVKAKGLKSQAKLAMLERLIAFRNKIEDNLNEDSKSDNQIS
ncbi:hypothetical protein L584_12015 [Pantoea agglomerans Tx10]|uniref:hypothetical protein n=1 Tax=Enterobacter agglomerans TaxID=549 RepID=UPI0003B21674|nr:hypothetical protein [Pantoea agglomerans]ERM10516.1 hypothetical protein L584_12015 [Pantoea agglomerans Tx10]